MSLGVLAIGTPVISAAAVVAVVLISLGPRQAIQALASIVLIKTLNPRIYGFPPYLGVLAWVALFLAAVRVLRRLKVNMFSVLGPLWFFVFVVAMLTAFGSANTLVSYMKLASFAVGATAVVVAALSLRAREAQLLRVQLPTVVLAVAAVSVLTVPFPGVSRLAPWLFQGILNHSQSLGTLLAPLVAVLAGRLLFRRKDFTKFDAAAVALASGLIIASGTRTAAIAVFLGLIGTIALGAMGGRARRKEVLQGVGRALGIGAVLLVVVLSSGGATDLFTGFVFKQSGEESVDEAFMASRGNGIESHWQHFLEEPLIGNGFGVYPDGQWLTPPVMFMGLPISAPVEKGFLPTAVLEEIGLIGAGAFLLLVVALVRRAYRTGDNVWTGVLLTCLFLNLGEAMFFSMGGDGMLIWIWMGLAMRGMAPLPSELSKLGGKAPSRGSGQSTRGGIARLSHGGGDLPAHGGGADSQVLVRTVRHRRDNASVNMRL